MTSTVEGVDRNRVEKEREKDSYFFLFFLEFALSLSSLFFLFFSSNMSSKKKNNRRKKKKVPTTTMQVNSERNGNRLWRIVMDHPNIFDTHIVTKLNGNDVKFFYDVNTESRAAIKRSSARLPNAFKIRELNTNSTLSWALEKCSENSSFWHKWL